MRSRLLLSLALAASGLLAAAPASAGSAPHKAAGISIWYPDDWATSEEEDLLEVYNGEDPDASEAYMYFWMVEATDMDSAIEELGQDVQRWVKNVKWANPRGSERKVNGMPAFYFDGTAVAKEGSFTGKPVDITAELVGTPKGKVMVIYGQFLSGGANAAKLDKDIEKILTSMKPL